MINLVHQTIENKDIDNLIEWLKTYPHLTKGPKTIEFENIWSKYLGCRYSVFVNSGSSANLIMMYVNKIIQEKRKSRNNNRIIIPAVSWATDLAPAIQLGLEPYLCDASKKDLGVDINHFEYLCKKHQCKTTIIVHVLGIPSQLNDICYICKKYNVTLLEDSCESIGSTFNGVKTGRFGLMSSFSFYFGHHMSTIEGGMVCTNDKEIYDIVKMIRSHGWDRDLDVGKQKELKEQYNINDFDALFTFYVPGFNFRATDIQAYIGINQLKNLDTNNQKRYNNYLMYQKQIKNDYWKLPDNNNFISNFAYPIIHPNKKAIVKSLLSNDVECRPLICGSLGNQPVFKEFVKTSLNKNKIIESLKFANIIHEYGFYIPNHPNLTNQELNFICSIINKEIK